MNLVRSASLAVCVLWVSGLTVRAANDPASSLSKINWTKGPAKASMNGIAQVAVPPGYMFTDGRGAKRLLEAMGNISTDEEVGFLSPTNMGWFVVFEFDPVGFVKDEDKDKLDADKMLASIREGTEEANKEREKMGAPAMHIVGWEQPPHYNSETHNLEWAIRGESEGEPVLNYNTRLLGRKGVMHVTLVADPKEMPTAMPGFKTLLSGYSFSTGQTYSEYRSGDKVAKYGLAALVVGGAAAGAAKLGLLGPLLILLKKLWFLVVAAVAAVVGFIKRMFARLTGRGSDNTST